MFANVLNITQNTLCVRYKEGRLFCQDVFMYEYGYPDPGSGSNSGSRLSSSSQINTWLFVTRISTEFCNVTQHFSKLKSLFFVKKKFDNIFALIGPVSPVRSVLYL